MKRGIIIILIMMSLQAVHGQFSWNHDLSAIAKPWSNSSWIYFKDSSQIDPLTIFNEYNEAFNLSQDDSLALIRTTFTPSVNMAHYVYQQYYKDIKVEGGYITIHSKNDYAQDANGAIIQGISLNITPTLNATAALDSALLIIGANKYMWQDSLAENSIKLQQNDTNATYYPKPELIIASIFSDSGIYATNFHLCYKIDIISYDPNEGYTIYIDANSGKSLGIHNLFSRNNCESGTVNTLYNGTQNFFTSTSDNINYKLKEDCNGRKIETYYSSQIGVKNIFEQSSNTWDVSLSAILASAHWAAEKVFEFYSSYNHIGYDNDPTTILKTVYLDYDGDYVKWDKSQNQVVIPRKYGTAFNEAVELDVIGHEFTHGFFHKYVPNFNGTPHMDKEAINEGLADIMGAMIEYSIEQNNDWYIMFNKHDTRIRNMKDPYPYPDTYRKDNWELPISNTYFDGIQHNNSTVFSHWFYLLVSGGSGVNDWGDSYNLSSINMDDMIKIVLHTFINGYYTSNGSYYDLAMGTIKAAYDLFGTNMAESIYHGWAAVGVYGGCKSNTTSFIINNAAIIDYGSIEEINYPITLPVTEVYGELIVKSILNIVGDNNSQSFKPQIQVYGGGKLTVDGGTITNDCIQNEVLENKVNGLFQNYYMEENIDLNWNGIIVLGTPNSNQFGSQQGKVIMNNAIIKNVDKTAVSLGENNFSGGGYIIATNSKFINCANAVKFYPYNNNIENGINYGNSSYFSNCEFIINKKLVDENQDYDPFILLYGNSGVNFKGCTFKNEIPNQFNNDKRGIGIYAFQSSFNVIPLNLTCSLSICKSKFENLHRGIMMEYYRGMSKPNKIKNNIFTNNVKGILARGGSSVITENIFNIPTTSLSSGEYSHGLYIEGYNGNVVQENTFSGNELSTNAAFGLVVNNTGSYNINEYYKNYFSGNLSVSNSYYNSTPHVQFKCNDYNSHPYINVQIESPYFDDQSFCQPDQQAVDYYTAPAGNIFHTTTNNNYPQILLSQNVIESEIKYAHHDAILYEPTTVTSFSSITSWLNNNCNVNAQDHCPTKLSIGQSFSGVLQDLHLKKQTVANYFDNGNTYTFVSNIKNSSYSTTNLYNDLKNYSNLSDEVLTHLISRSNKLNSLQLIDIYKKNAPHSNNVLVSLKYHYPTFYANYIDSINYYQTLTNSRKDSLSKYYYLNNNYQIIQNEYFSHLAEVDSSEQIKIILENDSTIESKLKLIPLLINEGELINASNLISNMPIFNKELYYFKDFYNFIINNTDSSNTLQIDSTDLSYLESIINTNAPIGTVAKNIKNQYFNILNSEYYNLPDLNNYKKENYNIQYLSTNMTIYPNPASDQIFIRINDINENGKIKIYNLQGKIISYLDLKEQVTTVNTSNWSQGIYILEYSINNNRLHKKISIIK